MPRSLRLIIFSFLGAVAATILVLVQVAFPSNELWRTSFLEPFWRPTGLYDGLAASLFLIAALTGRAIVGGRRVFRQHRTYLGAVLFVLVALLYFVVVTSTPLFPLSLPIGLAIMLVGLLLFFWLAFGGFDKAGAGAVVLVVLAHTTAVAVGALGNDPFWADAIGLGLLIAIGGVWERERSKPVTIRAAA